MIRVTAFVDGESQGTGAYDLERILIGSAPDVDLRVREDGVLEEHAEVFASGDKLFIRRLGEGDILINGASMVAERQQLSKQDRVKIGGDIEFGIALGSASKQTMQHKRVASGAVSFGGWQAAGGEDDGASNAPIDLTKVKATSSTRRPTVEPEEDDDVKKAKRKALTVIGVSLVVTVLVGYFAVFPTVKKYFFWEDDRIPGRR